MAVRLFGRVHPARGGVPVKEIRFRVQARRTPAGAHVDVSDVQVQPGWAITGYTPSPLDIGVEPVEGWQFRNGVVYGNSTLVVVADTPSASPTRWEVTRANGRCRIGDYHLGHVTTAVIDGHAGTASQGAGIPPHLTARADNDVPIELEGRAAVTVWFRGLTVADPEPIPVDPDPIDPDEPWPDPVPEVPEEPPEPPPPEPDEGAPEDP